MIHFTQYMRPNGRKQATTIDRPEEVEAVARKVVEAGGRFEIEMLNNGTISMEVVADDPDDPGELRSLAHELCSNGPDVPVSVDKLVADAAKTLGLVD